MKSVVITGATSMLGVALANECIRQGVEVFAVVRPGTEKVTRLHRNPMVTIIECDLSDYGSLHEKIQCEETVDAFFHLAWTSSKKEDRQNKEKQHINVSYVKSAILAASNLGCKQFVGAGSQAEYGIMNELANENTTCKPVNEYGKSKYMAYTEGKEEARRHEIAFTWVRIFSLYGIYDNDDTLIQQLMRSLKRMELIGLTKCSQIWDYLYADDAAVVFYELASKMISGLFCLGSGSPQPLREYVETVAKVYVQSLREAGSECTENDVMELLDFGSVPMAKDQSIVVAPDITKLKEAINFSPKIGFEEGMRHLISGTTLNVEEVG